MNGKRRNPKKVLRRRSSGGAEIFTPAVSESLDLPISNNLESLSENRYTTLVSPRRTESDSLLSKRRGSLPTEVSSVGLGKYQ